MEGQCEAIVSQINWNSFVCLSNLSRTVVLGGYTCFPMKKAGEERGTLKAERVGNLVDGKISVAQQHLCAENAVGVKPVHDTSATLLPDNGRQVIGGNTEMVGIGLDVSRKRVFPA